MKDYSINSQTFLDNLSKLKLFIKKYKFQNETTIQNLFKQPKFDESGCIIISSGHELTLAVGLVYFFNIKNDDSIDLTRATFYKQDFSHKRILHFDMLVECDLNFLNVSNVQNFSKLFSEETNPIIPFIFNQEHGCVYFEFEHHNIHPLFETWDLTNATIMDYMFFNSNYEGNSKPLIIKAKNLISVKKMFLLSKFKDEVVIESDSLINISHVISYKEDKEKSPIKITLPLNNIIAFEANQKCYFKLNNLKSHVFNQNQKGFHEFIKHFFYFSSLMEIDISFKDIQDVFPEVENMLDDKFFNIAKEKEIFKLKHKNSIKNLNDLEQIFAMKVLLNSDCSINFKKFIIGKNPKIFQDALLLLLNEKCLDKEFYFDCEQTILDFKIPKLTKYNFINSIDEHLMKINHFLISLNIDLFSNGINFNNKIGCLKI